MITTEITKNRNQKTKSLQVFSKVVLILSKETVTWRNTPIPDSLDVNSDG